MPFPKIVTKSSQKDSLTSLSKTFGSPCTVRNKPVRHQLVPDHFQVTHSSHHVP